MIPVNPHEYWICGAGTIFSISFGVMERHGKTLTERLNALEKEAIAEALAENGWVKAKAARMLGITERMIGYKIKKYGISKEVERRGLYM